MNRNGTQIVKDMFIIVLASTAIGLGINMVHPRGFVLVSRSEQAKSRIIAISSEEARIKYDSQAALFIDAREKGEYTAARVANAVNIPAGDVVTRPESVDFTFLEKPVEVVVYCDGASCRASHIVAERMLALTPRHIYILEKGFPDWAAKGYPVMRGD